MVGSYIKFNSKEGVRKGKILDKNTLAYNSKKEFKTTENGDVEILKEATDYTLEYIGLNYYLVEDLESGQTFNISPGSIVGIIDPIITDIDDYCTEVSKLIRITAEVSAKSRTKTVAWGKIRDIFNRKDNPIRVEMFGNGNVHFIKSQELIKEEKQL